MKTLQNIILVLAFALLTSQSFAAITVQGYWQLGEAGTSGASNLPLDSSGNARNFINAIGSMTTVVGGVDSRAAAHGSTAYYNDTGAVTPGYYANGYNAPEDNVGIEIFARINAGGSTGDRTIFATGGGQGLRLRITSSGFGATYDGVGTVGSSFVPTIGQWYHLALVRDGGTGSFYVDGVRIGGTSALVPVDGGAGQAFHFGVTSGGGDGFIGNVDSARVFTFTAGNFNVGELLAAVPEPSTITLMGLGMLGLFWAYRRHKFSLPRNVIATTITAAICALFTSQSFAAITVQGYWQLGEAGTSGASNLPLDSSGNGRNFINPNGANMLTVVGGVDPRAAAHGSTGYYNDTAATGGYYGILSAPTQPTDNVGVEMFARMTQANDLGADRTILDLLGGTGGIKINTTTFGLPAGQSGFAVGINGVAQVGSTFVPVDNQWYHLAFVRAGGVDRFYVDGVQFGATGTAAPTGSAMGTHFGVNPGGSTGFVGNIDQMRFFTFAAGQFSVGDLLSTVPEPSTITLMVLGLGGLFAIRRKMKRI